MNELNQFKNSSTSFGSGYTTPKRKRKSMFGAMLSVLVSSIETKRMILVIAPPR